MPKEKDEGLSESIIPSTGDQPEVESSPVSNELLNQIDDIELYTLLYDDPKPTAPCTQELPEESNQNPSPSLDLVFSPNTRAAFVQSITNPINNIKETHQQDNINEIDKKNKKSEINKKHRSQLRKLDPTKIASQPRLHQYLNVIQNKSRWDTLAKNLKIRKIGTYLEKKPITLTNQSLDTEKETDLTFTSKTNATLLQSRTILNNNTVETHQQDQSNNNNLIENINPKAKVSKLDRENSKKLKSTQKDLVSYTHPLLNNISQSGMIDANPNSNPADTLSNAQVEQVALTTENTIQLSNTTEFNYKNEKKVRYKVKENGFNIQINGVDKEFKQGRSKTIESWSKNDIYDKTIIEELVAKKWLVKDENYQPNPIRKKFRHLSFDKGLEKSNKLREHNRKFGSEQMKLQSLPDDHILVSSTNEKKSRDLWYKQGRKILNQGENIGSFLIPLSPKSTSTTNTNASSEKTETGNIKPVTQNINCNYTNKSSLFNIENSSNRVGNFTKWGDFFKQTMCSNIYIFHSIYHIESIFEDETDVQIFLPNLNWDDITECLTNVRSIFANSSCKVAAVIYRDSKFFMLFANCKNGSLTIDIINSYHNKSNSEIIKISLEKFAQVKSFDLAKFTNATDDHILISMILTSYFFSNTFIDFNSQNINDLCTREEIEKLNKQFKQFSSSTNQQIESSQNNEVSVASSRADEVGVATHSKPTKKRKYSEINPLTTTIQNSNNNNIPVLSQQNRESRTNVPFLGTLPAPVLPSGLRFLQPKIDRSRETRDFFKQFRKPFNSQNPSIPDTEKNKSDSEQASKQFQSNNKGQK